MASSAAESSVTEQDYVILALAQLTAVLDSLTDGDPRHWSDTSDPWRTERDFKLWRQDVWWMFYQQDPFCEEMFSLEACCSHIADAFKISLTADSVRESCFRNGMCPPESKIVNRRCKRARIHVLSKVEVTTK